MTKYLITTSFFFLAIITSGCKSTKIISDQEASSAIKAVLSAQEDAWNRGDIDAFMEGYWKDERLTFIGKSGVNRGWQTTLNNYKKGYPDEDAMGKLQFDIINMVRISADAYQVIGRYTLVRKTDKPTGIFTLLWRFVDGKWVIVSDHTSG